MDLQFKIATVNDIVTINQLAINIWNAHYLSIISQQQIDYMLDMMYSKDALLQQMQEQHCEFTLVYLHENPVGYISIQEENEGEYFIHKFYVDTTLHQKGIGTALFKYVFEKKNIKTIRLFVNRENYKPINFYFKLGFKIESIIDKHIGNNFYMNDFVMLKKLV